MAFEDKGFRTPPPIEPRGKGPYIPKKSSRFDKGGLGREAKNIFRKEVISPFGQALRNVLFPQKSAKKDLKDSEGTKIKKEKKVIPPKVKSSLFGKEKFIKDSDFEKFLDDNSLYSLDKLSRYERKKKWREIFKKTGTGYLQRWKVKKYFKERALKPPISEKEKNIDKQYRKKILGE